jgi:methionyl-tRNA formyltransferase
MIRVLFIGTSEFAVHFIKKLTEIEYIDLVGVITQPDKPIGRKQILSPPPVKEYLQSTSSKIKVFQPERLGQDAKQILDETKPEIVIVVAYGQMIPDGMLNYPKFKCLNIHGSLLPKLRGAVPVPMAILNGFDKTGITIQIMEKKLDAGDILASKDVEIANDDNTESLKLKLADIGTKLLEETLPKWADSTGKSRLTPTRQNESESTFCVQSDISKEKAELLKTDSAEIIDRKIRAFYPWPISWGILRNPESNKQDRGIESIEKFTDKRFMIYKAKIIDKDHFNKKGLKLFRRENSLILRCDTGWLEILECQLEGKKRLSGRDYLFLARDTMTSIRGILIKDNKILLIHRIKAGNDYYATPGGAQMVGEKVEDALKREFLEETNQIIIPKELAYESHFVFDDGSSFTHLNYLCELSSDSIDRTLKMIGEETQYDQKENFYELCWIPVKDAVKLNIPEDLKKYLEKLN